MEWSTLASEFKKQFPAAEYRFREVENGFIFAALKGGDDSIHFELINRNGMFFIEYHVETNRQPNYVNALLELFNRPENVRRYTFGTYYSSKHWQTRTPVFTCEDIAEDVTNLRAVVGEIICDAQNSIVQTEEKKFPLLHGNYATSPCEVAKYLRDGTLMIPDIQRGKVWNVARIGTLWDSMLRNFPIGCFSVQENATGVLELLDGQQRSYAISLGFCDFPNPKRKEPILWLECAPEEDHHKQGEKVFIFHVTTCAHPWGYRLAEDEMRNSTLSAEEKRRAANGVEGHQDNAGKPYPDELYPYFSQMPVPVSLLTQWFSLKKKCPSRDWKDFKQWCLDTKHGQSWRWLEKIGNKTPSEDYWEKICKAFLELDKEEIFLTSAANVDAENIALYFTRIGRGGVVPSDEELAYSVLKSKIGNGFREKIENIAQNGMAPAARIAHLAVRCFASDRGDFYCGSILEQANRIGREKGEQFATFMENFCELTKKVNDAVLTKEAHDGDGIFISWHRSRYCTYANGDIYLFLLLTARDSENDLADAIGMSEYIHCFANNVRLTLQIIRRNGIREGLIEALKTSRYRTPILEFPISPDEFPNPISMGDLKKWWNEPQHHAAVELLKRGYGNLKAYSMLLFACGGAISQNDYDPYSVEWSDESCPWDYDHILPRSWFDKIGGTPEAFFCNELKNSIGNLAPLPFSLNRALSDNERQKCYPCSQEDETTKKIQQQLYIHREMVATKVFSNQETGGNERQKFCFATLARFKEIYSCWFSAVGLQEFFAKQEKSNRRKLFEKISESMPETKIFYVDGDRQYQFDNELDWLRPWLAVGIVTTNDFVAVASDGSKIEIGMRRRPENSNIDGQPIWYRSNECNTSYSFSEDNGKLAENLVKGLKELIVKSEQATSQES